MSQAQMQQIVVKIARSTPRDTARKIGSALVQLEAEPESETPGTIEIAAVSVESYVSRQFVPIADNVYVNTQLPIEQLRALLRDQLGSDAQYCSIAFAPAA